MKRNKFIRGVGLLFNRYINGARGAISLLLAIAVSPLLTVSLVLVESARFQNVVQLIEELTDASSFSALANYDPYLDERFGLLAVSQELEIDDTFSGYMESNINLLGKGATISDTAATGKFALSDKSVLKQQITEYGELMITSEALFEGLDIEKLLDKLREMLNLKDITKELEAVEAGIDVAKELEIIIDAITGIQKEYDEYSKALTA